MVQFHDMPRAAQSDDAPKRSPRKRATTTRTTADRVPRRTAPRKRVAPRVDSYEAPTRVESPVEERVVERRAPTPVAATRARARARQFQLLVSVVIIVIGIGASAAVGVTDDGQIDVVQTIEERNERIRTGQGNEQERNSVIVPVQNTNERQVDGGLRGRGVGTPTPVVPDPLASSTASSTDATASSTDATASSTDATTTETAEASDAPEVVATEEATTPEPETETAPAEADAEVIDDAGR